MMHFSDLARPHGTLEYDKLFNKMCKLHCNYLKLCSVNTDFFVFTYILFSINNIIRKKIFSKSDFICPCDCTCQSHRLHCDGEWLDLRHSRHTKKVCSTSLNDASSSSIYLFIFLQMLQFFRVLLAESTVFVGALCCSLIWGLLHFISSMYGLRRDSLFPVFSCCCLFFIRKTFIK